MRTTKFKGEPLSLKGVELKAGDKFPSFKLTSNSMTDVTQTVLSLKTTVILTVPSLDTPVCDIEAKRFCKDLGATAQLLTVSRDLPFAQSRWCVAADQKEGSSNLVTASDYKYRTFGETTGTLIEDWQLLSRAVFVVDSTGTIKYVEYVEEIGAEPDYEVVLKVVASLNG